MYLVFDIGGTKTRFAYSNDLNQFEGEPTVFSTEKIYEKELEQIKRSLKNSKISAVIGGLPGLIQDGKLIFAPNLPNFIQKSLVTDLAKTFNTISLDLYNDAYLSALGEAHFGSGKNFKTFCYITLSTGIGGSIVRNKKIDDFSFFEPGHMIFDPVNNLTFEEVFSGGAIKKRFEGKSPDHTDRAFWRDIEKGLAQLLNNINMVNPVDAFVVGGGIVIRDNVNLDNVRKYYKSFSRIDSCPQIIKTKLGDYSGLYGGLVKLKEKFAN